MTGIDVKFQPFPILPGEIRDEIWRLAWCKSDGGLSDRQVCILGVGGKKGKLSMAAPRVVHEARNQALLVTCRDSRAIARRHGYMRDYDPTSDILYVSQKLFTTFTSDMCGLGGEEWVHDIHHLALALPVVDYGLWLPFAFKRLLSLKSISVVYPTCQGVIGRSSNVTNDRKDAALRLLTKEETQNLTVTANYVEEAYGAPEGIQVQWAMRVQEHLGLVASRLQENCRSVRLQDGGAARLCAKLRYEARYFDCNGPGKES